MSATVKNRRAITRGNGRTDHSAEVWAGRTSFPWRCVCRPEDGHDHAAQHEKLARGLEVRDAVIDGLHGLVGESGRLGLLRYHVTDCNIQIHGPEKWRLYVAWDETPVSGGEEAARREWETDYVNPELCPAPADVIAAIEAAVTENGQRWAAAVRAAGEFNAAGG